MNNVANKKNRGGFTLVETLVAVAIFTIVMTIATGATFSIIQANKKAQTLKSVMSNLNFALETISREIRTGENYYSGTGGGQSDSKDTQDLTVGDSVFEFTSNKDTDNSNGNDRVIYARGTGTDCGASAGSTNGCITKQTLAGTSEVLPITSDEINIESLKFYVMGSANYASTDRKQPRVVVAIKGTAGSGNIASSFNIQTTLTQRVLEK